MWFFIYAKKKSKKNAAVAAIIGAVLMGILSIPVNYFITYPFYYNFMPKEAILQAYQLIVPSMKSILQCLVCFNFPFAFFTQLFFIQPIVRTVFKWIFAKDIKARTKESVTA